MSDGVYKLLGGEISYFTGKVRAYLQYKGVPYEELLATRDVYKHEIMPRVGFPVVPVVIGPDDETLQDSTVIFDTLESRDPEPAILPATPRQRVLSLLLELFGDEWMKLPAMHYRWNLNRDFAVAEFGALSQPDLTKAEQIEIGERTSKNFAGMLPMLGVNDETIPAIEASYEGLLAELDSHFALHPYLFGSRPSVGDFGLFGPLYAHLYRDPASGEIMERLAPNVVAWVKRLRAPDVRAGRFLEDDEIPSTLLPVLARMANEFFPVLESVISMFQQWLEDNPQGDIPRVIGMADFTLLAGTEQARSGKLAAFPYWQWMFQRAQDAYDSLAASERASVDLFMKSIGGGTVLKLAIERRVEIRNFQLSRA